MKVSLCDPKSCCPSVEILEDKVKIGEDENTCTLNMQEWNNLRDKIKKGEL